MDNDGAPRRTKMWWRERWALLVGVALLTVGAILMLTAPAPEFVAIANAPLSSTTFSGPMPLKTAQGLIGAAAMLLGLLLVAGLAGYRLAQRRSG